MSTVRESLTCRFGRIYDSGCSRNLIRNKLESEAIDVTFRRNRHGPDGSRAYISRELGVTLTHEHVFIHFKPLYLEPQEGSRKGLAMKPVTIDDVGWIRGNWASNYENLGLYDEELMIKE